MYSNQNRTDHIYGIDVLRFLSALLVCVLHFRGNGAENPFVTYLCTEFGNIKIIETKLNVFDYLGFIGVETFFTISGFVIAYSLTKTLNIIEFIKGRIVRIYPSLIIVTIISSLLTTAVGFNSFPNVLFMAIRDLTLFPVGFHLNGVVWTLTIEAIFYIFSAIIYRYGGKNISLFVWFYSVASLLYYALDFYLSAYLTTEKSFLDVFRKFGRLTLLEHGMYFSLGIVMYEVFIRNRNIKNFALPFLFMATSIVISINGVTNYYVDIDTNSSAPTSPIYALAIYAAFSIAMGLSIKYATKVSRFGNRFIFSLGRLTYPLYLSHIYVGGLFCYGAIYLGFGQFATPVAITGSIVVSYILALYAEPVIARAIKSIIGLHNPARGNGV